MLLDFILHCWDILSNKMDSLLALVIVILCTLIVAILDVVADFFLSFFC